MNDNQPQEGIRRNLIFLPISLVLLFACLQLPFSGFMADDLIQLGILEKVSPNTWAGPFTLYSLADGNPGHMQKLQESGAFPWFFHSHFKLHFFRPLSSALLALDHRLFGLHPLGYGIHSILWLLILVWGTCRLYKKILPWTTRNQAAILFAVSGILPTAAYWGACRHNLIAPALGLWAFLAYLEWRNNGRSRFLVLSLIGFSLALLAGEAAIAILAYPLAHALLAHREERKQRIISLLPLLFLALAYLIFYRAAGYGAGAGSDYQNPLSNPAGFIRILPQRLASTAGALFFGGTADLLVADLSGKPYLAIAGTFAFFFLVFLIRRSWTVFTDSEKQPLRWLLAGSILSSLPFAASMTISFHMIVPFIGWCGVLALLFGSRAQVKLKNKGWKRILFQTGCILLFFFHLIMGPFLRAANPYFLKKMMSDRPGAAMQKLDRDFPDISRSHLVIINAPDIAIGFHTYFYRRLHRLPMPASWRVLYWGRRETIIRKTNENAFSMEFPGGWHQRSGFQPGHKIELAGIKIQVTAATGNKINAIDYRLDRSLDDPSLVLLSWNQGRLERIRLPAGGESVVLNIVKGLE